MEISDKSHPYFTGKQNLIDTAGRMRNLTKSIRLIKRLIIIKIARNRLHCNPYFYI